MNVFLINDSSSNPNWGDRAAAIALKRMIKDMGCNISSCITEDELRDGEYFLDAADTTEAPESRKTVRDWIKLFLPPLLLKVRSRILHRLRRNSDSVSGPIPLTVDSFESQADYVMQNHAEYARLINSIEGADLMVIHGDGCMTGNGIMPRSELFLGYLAKTRFRKPVILINHTADFSHAELNRMAELVYPELDDVTYRDQTSADLCSDHWSGRYAADTAFQFAPAERDVWSSLAARSTYFDIWPDHAIFNPEQPYICVGGSSIYSFDGRPTNIINGFISLVQHLQTCYRGQIVLTASDTKDQVLFRPVARALGLPLIGLTIPVQQAVDIVGHSQAYVGGRWHVGIFALRGGAPVIPLTSKTFKIPALIEMADLQTTTFNANDLEGEKEEIGRTLVGFLQQGEVLRKRLREWSRQQAENSWDNLAFVERLSRGSA